MAEAPFRLLENDDELSPLVVSVPHAGLGVPDEDADTVGADDRTRRRDADLFVDRLYERAPELGAAFLCATLSRYVLDLNRSPDDVDREVCPSWPRPARANPRALIWRLSTEGAAVLPRPLTREEVQSRIRRVHTPYHEQLRALLEARRERFGYAILLDAHSMPSVGRATHSDPGTRRADVVPGDVRGRSCGARLSETVGEHFESAGYGVRANEPYMGGFITRHHGRPDQHIHAIQIELNRDLYMEETSCEYDEARAGKLRGDLDALLEKLVRFDPRD
jgi:N-formylglutamate amidohydrolase